MYLVPQGQIDRVDDEGVEGMDDYFALAGGAIGLAYLSAARDLARSDESDGSEVLDTFGFDEG